ncbi:MAG TPA: NAD(P)H-dependent glycerol-3-phosphate dehydrogenase [Cytophagales bacterium]
MLKTKEKAPPATIAVIGGGSWATALIKILSEQPVKVQWWLRNQADAAYIHQYGHNPHYLSDVQLNRRKVTMCARVEDAVAGATHVILAVPAAFVQSALSGLPAEALAGKVVVSAIKGMIPEQNLLVTDWVERDYGVTPGHICVIAGPCHAEEVALEKQSYLTIASADAAQAEGVARLLTCRYVQASALDDVYGVEYCAVMKNIIALACGITHGLNYGDNFQAVLVSNAMQEIRRFLDAIYPRERDLSASVYLGDLLVTAYSQFSRNRTFGNMIGRGYSVQSAQVEMNMIAEGYYAVKSIHEINRQYGVSMPITEAVFRILYEKVPPAQEVGGLRKRLK